MELAVHARGELPYVYCDLLEAELSLVKWNFSSEERTKALRRPEVSIPSSPSRAGSTTCGAGHDSAGGQTPKKCSYAPTVFPYKTGCEGSMFLCGIPDSNGCPSNVRSQNAAYSLLRSDSFGRNRGARGKERDDRG